MSGSKLLSVAVLWLMIASAAVVALTALSDGADAYIPHAPIDIDGNADFADTALAESWPGDGTESDPYVIDSLQITGGPEFAISIRNTDVYFVISNGSFSECYSSAIYLYNVENAVVRNNTFSSCQSYSIYCEYSECVSLSNNTIEGGTHCIGLIFVMTASVENNTVTDAEDWSLCMVYAWNVTMRGNDFQGSNIGIYGDLPEWNSHDIDASNTVNGGPVRYFKDCVGGTVPSDAGQVILANCTGMIVQGVGMNGTSSAISVAYGRDNVVTGCAVSDVYQGVFLWCSLNTMVESVSVDDCGRGIEMWDSEDCVIEQSIVTGCGYALWIQDSIRTSVLQNSILEAEYDGIFLYYSSFSEVTGNLVSNGYGDGLALFCAESNNISLNTFMDNQGLAVDASIMSPENRIFNNSFVRNHGSSDVFDPSKPQAIDQFGESNWNQSGSPGRGNYWYDWTTPDEDSDGIVDSPYNVSVGYDYYPLVSPPTHIPGADLADVHLSISFDRTAYRPDEDVVFSVEMVNNGELPVEIVFPTSQIFDFHVEDSEEQVVFDFAPETLPTFVTLPLGPGEAYSEELTWPQATDPVPSPADYTVFAYPASELALIMGANRTIAIDGDAPVSEATMDGQEGETGWFVSPVDVTIDASDEWSGIDFTEYRIDGSAWQTYSVAFEMSEDGTQTLEWRSTDNAGNVEDVRSAEVKIDCGLPDVDVVPENGTAFSAATVDIEIECSDAISGIASVVYSLDGGEFAASDDDETVSLSGLTEGDHSLELQVSDTAGNTATVVFTFEVQISDDGDTDTSDDDGDLWLIALALVVAAAVVIAVVATLMRRRNSQGPKE